MSENVIERMKRQYFLHKADSYIDAIGYMACAGEIAEKENEE